MFTGAGGIAGLSRSRLAWVFLFAAMTSPCADNPSESTTKQPLVTSVTQITRDGVSKTNLLVDDSNIYVTEWPSARHVVAKIALSGANPSIISSAFPNVQALDISPDHSKLLISPMQGNESEFWTLPVGAGTPQRLGEIRGRD